MINVPSRTLGLKEFIDDSNYLIDNLQDRVTQTLNSQKYPNLTDSFNLELHQILNPLRSIVHKIETGYNNVDKFLKMREECDKTISQYIEVVSKIPEFGEGADDIILLQKHIISNQRNLITQLLIPNFPVDTVPVINIDQPRRPSVDSRNRSKSVASHISFDEESDLLPMNLKIATMLQQYEEDLIANFARELEIRKEENRILHEELDKKYPVVKPIEPNEIYKKRINELEIIIDQLKVENLELQSDSNYLLVNANHILIPFEEKNRLSNNNNNNNNTLEHSNYILFDTLETIKNDLSIIHKELNRIIKMKNNYITNIESNKYDEYNKTISAVNELANNNNNVTDPLISPKRNKILSESIKKCSELIRNVGDITSDYKRMKDKIKDEMREEMKEKYMLMNKQKTMQYKKLEEENNRLKELLKLRENELELVERENERLKMMKEDVLSHLLRQLNSINNSHNNNNNNNEDNNNNSEITDYMNRKYSIKRKECLLKDITIQYLKSIINKQKQVSNLSNVQVVSLIQEFNQIKTQYEELLYNDINDNSIIMNNKNSYSMNLSTTLTRGRVFSLSFPPSAVMNHSSLSPFSPSHLHNSNITPLCFHKSLIFDNNNSNFSYNNVSTPHSCRSTASSCSNISDSINSSSTPPLSPSVPTIYTKWSKKISELEDLLEDKNEEINDLQLIIVKNQNRINELEIEYKNKEIISINLQNQLNHMIDNENKHNTMKYNLGIIHYDRIDIECKHFTLSSIILDESKINDKNEDEDDQSTVYTHESERYKEDLDAKVYSVISILSNKHSDYVQLNDFELRRIMDILKNGEYDICIYEYFMRKLFVLAVSLFLMVIYI